jgi:hypothetical protein
MVNEDRLESLEIELSGKVRDGEIFVVKFAVRFRRVTVTLYQMAEHLPVRGDMPILVHGHEPTQHETRIYLPSTA